MQTPVTIAMEHFYQKIHGWFDFQAVYLLMIQRAGERAHFVEVGAFEGKSTSFMAVEIANCDKEIRFDVIDTWEGSEEHQPGGAHASPIIASNELYDAFIRNMRPVEHIINPIRLPSLQAAASYPDRSLDFVFIDASHDYENVKADILAWRPKVKLNGYLGGHDYQELFPGVMQAVAEVVPTFDVLEFSWLTQITEP